MFAARFQSFEDSGDRGASAPRVAALRAELARRGLDGFVVPRADRFQNEYVPPCAERLAWLTGFTGSAGLAIVLADRAALFVDGRYQVQVHEEVDGEIFSVAHLVEHPPHEWLEANLRAGARLGYSPWLHTVDGTERLDKACAAAGASLVPVTDNPIDAIWTDRPPPPCGAVVLHDLRYAGESAQEKLARVRGAIEKASADALVVSDPHAVSWLFNIRGSDIPHTPVVLAFALVPREGRPALYVDGRKLGNDVRHRLEEIADVRASAEFERGLAALGGERRKVRLDPSASPEAIARLLAESGGTIAARRRSDRADEGGEERGRDRRRARGATARRRGGDAFSRLVRRARRRPAASPRSTLSRRWRVFAATPACSRTFPSRPSPAPAPTAPSCIIASPAAATAASRRANSFSSIPARSTRTAPPTSPAPSRSARRRRHAGAFHPRAQGPYRHCPRGVSRGHHAAPSSIRSRGNFSGRPGSILITAPATASAATSRCTKARQRISKLGSAALKRGMILSNEPGYYSDGAYGIRIENLVLVSRRRRSPERKSRSTPSRR